MMVPIHVRKRDTIQMSGLCGHFERTLAKSVFYKPQAEHITVGPPLSRDSELFISTVDAKVEYRFAICVSPLSKQCLELEY